MSHGLFSRLQKIFPPSNATDDERLLRMSTLPSFDDALYAFRGSNLHDLEITDLPTPYVSDLKLQGSVEEWSYVKAMRTRLKLPKRPSASDVLQAEGANVLGLELETANDSSTGVSDD